MKHRSTATELIENGNLRLNRAKISKPGHSLKVGDILTFALHGQVHVVKVLAEAERRGPATQARSLYEELPQTATQPRQTVSSDAEKVSA